jgi:ATP-dependent DNA helicase PIF1
VKQLKAKGKQVHIIAPTNLAALAVNGKTTWNYAGWKPDNMKKPLEELENNAHGKEVYKRFNKTDVLVIDEVSMVENLLFERLNAVMKAARKSGKAFGGVQIVVTGDVRHQRYFEKQMLTYSVLPIIPRETFPVLH